MADPIEPQPPDTMDGNAIHLAGKIVLLDRGQVTIPDEPPGHALLIGGVLVTPDGCPLSDEVVQRFTAEQWDVEVVLVPKVRRRGLTEQRGDLCRLIARGMLADPSKWDEQYNPSTQKWEAIG